MPIVSCKKCAAEFYAKPSWLLKGHGKYCSAFCKHASDRKGKMVPCSICGKETYKQAKALRGSKSGKFFCSKSCQTKWRNTEFIEEKHANWKGGHYAYRRILRQSGRLELCGLCKITDTRVLAVHHIDHDHTNNTVENLAWLCHNCHHLVHHDRAEHRRFMAAIV